MPDKTGHSGPRGPLALGTIGACFVVALLSSCRLGTHKQEPEEKEDVVRTLDSSCVGSDGVKNTGELHVRSEFNIAFPVSQRPGRPGPSSVDLSSMPRCMRALTLPTILNNCKYTLLVRSYTSSSKLSDDINYKRVLIYQYYNHHF